MGLFWPVFGHRGFDGHYGATISEELQGVVGTSAGCSPWSSGAMGRGSQVIDDGEPERRYLCAGSEGVMVEVQRVAAV